MTGGTHGTGGTGRTGAPDRPGGTGVKGSTGKSGATGRAGSTDGTGVAGMAGAAGVAGGTGGTGGTDGTGADQGTDADRTGAAEGTGATEGTGSADMTGAADVALRDMRWWDLDAVIALEQDLFPEDAWSRGMFWSELADTRHPGATRHYVVAEDAAGRLVGYAGLAAVAGTGDVQTIAAARDHWGTGLGGRLLRELLRQATAFECHEVLLEVRVDNVRAQRLYERHGFQPIGLRRGYYQPGNVDALVMRTDLTKEGETDTHG